MSAKLAELGMMKKKSIKNKMYYVNRKSFAFSFPKMVNGERVKKVNPHTGLAQVNGRGEPEYVEETVMFKPWRTRFTDLGYWSVYEVTPETDSFLAKELEEMAKANNSEVMSEKKFLEHTNPMLGENFDELETLRKENEEIKSAKSKADEEIARLKQKAMQR